MAIGVIWGEIWNEAIWNTAIWSQAAASDTTPDAFSFTDQSGVALSSTITSAPITVTGIDAAAAITITGGTYDINGSGTFVSTEGTVNNGDTVRARQTSSASYLTATNTAVTIGGVSDTFTSTTTPDPSLSDPRGLGWLANRLGMGI
jgi:hypothetical protein